MAYIIVDTCTKDEHCIETCPVNCIHPTKDEADFATAPQLYVNPGECIDCGACVPVCPTGSIFVLEELPSTEPSFCPAPSSPPLCGELGFFLASALLVLI